SRRRPKESLTTKLAALKTGRPAEDADKFAKLMEHACRRARGWNVEDDPYEIRRRADRDFIESGLQPMAVAVRKLQRISKDHPDGFDAVVWRAVKVSGITPDMLREAGYDSGAGGQGGRFVRALLAALDAQIDNEGHPASRVVKGSATGGIHRYVYGPLRF